MTGILVERFRMCVRLRLSMFMMSRAEFCRRSTAAGMTCDQHWLHRVLRTDNLRIKDIETMATLLGLGQMGFFTLLGLDVGGDELSSDPEPAALHAIAVAPIPRHLISANEGCHD